MRSLILICVVCLQLEWSHGEPKGVGAVAYQDSTGRRYNNRGGFADFPGFGFGGPNMDNRAFASGVVGPSFSHQIAAISPPNPNQGNVDVMNRFSDVGNKPGFYSVQTSSFSSSSDIGGKKSNHRRAQTIVNKDGKITAYKVEN